MLRKRSVSRMTAWVMRTFSANEAQARMLQMLFSIACFGLAIINYIHGARTIHTAPPPDLDRHEQIISKY